MMKWWLKYCFSIIAAVGVSFSIYGQDAQFSQQMASPLWINPAMSGADGFLRGALNYRTQWNAVSDPFTTVAGSFDIALNQRPNPRKRKKGNPGLGVLFLADRAGSPTTRRTKIMLSGAYHVNLNENSSLGAGINAGYETLALDAGSGKWGSQYNGTQYDPSIAHGENLQSVQQTSMDVGGGVVFVYRRKANTRYDIKRSEVTIGLAGYQLGRVMLSEQNLFAANDDIRFSGFANAAFGVGNSGSALEPAVYFHRQGASQMLLAGASYRHVFSSGTSLIRESKTISMALGAFYRFGDAAIARLSFRWEGLEIGLSYDINTSRLSKYSSGQGAMEVSLSYRLAAPSYRR